MKVYTYWVSSENQQMPAYISLCIKTWRKHIPTLELILIDKGNVSEYLEDDIDMDSFNKLSLPQQSDVVSVAVLSRLGGVFIDADTIITKDCISCFLNKDNKVFYSFGYPAEKDIHLAVMWSIKKNNPVLVKWYEVIKEKMKDLPLLINWDYVGNSIIKPILNKADYKDDFEIIDRTINGNIMESVFNPSANASKSYSDFWFGPEVTSAEDIVAKATYGIISLHNSWTPHIFKQFPLEAVVSSNTTLSNLLCYLLDNETEK